MITLIGYKNLQEFARVLTQEEEPHGNGRSLLKSVKVYGLR